MDGTHISIKQPNKPRIPLKRPRGRQVRSLMIPPIPACPTESRQPGGGREPGAADGQDPLAARQLGVEGRHVVVACVHHFVFVVLLFAAVVCVVCPFFS